MGLISAARENFPGRGFETFPAAHKKGSLYYKFVTFQ